MNSEIKLDTNPSPDNLNLIENWLLEEEQESNEGFYCNWNIIENAFHEKRFLTLTYNDEPIGFCAWSQGGIHVEIDILEIKPNFRNKGLGRKFFEKISNYFKQKGDLAITLFCSPRESENFWVKMGLIKFPQMRQSDSRLYYYKTLIETLTCNKNIKTKNKIELWNVEPHKKDLNKPIWTWNIELVDENLELPIIQPCNYEWNIRWTKNGEIIKEHKVKYFLNSEDRVEKCPFLYIKDLKNTRLVISFF
mgnify:CR=1 FL=1